jgi:hypothetical protein
VELLSSVNVVPTAQQSEPPMQVTDDRNPWVAGVGTDDQETPFQCSAKVTGPGSAPTCCAPTAQQSDDVAQVTFHNNETCEPGSGVALSTDHVDPFQWSINALGWPLLFRLGMTPPTAQQFHELVQAVPRRMLESWALVLALGTMFHPDDAAAWVGGVSAAIASTPMHTELRRSAR